MMTLDSHVNIASSYKLYKETYKEKKGTVKSIMKKIDYTKLNIEYMKFIFKRLFETGEVKLPGLCGTLKIIGKKTKLEFGENGRIINRFIDWNETKKLHESDPETRENKVFIYFTNDNTDGISYKITWSKKGFFSQNKDLYIFVPTRNNKRAFAKLLKSGSFPEYPIVDVDKYKRNGKKD